MGGEKSPAYPGRPSVTSSASLLRGRCVARGFSRRSEACRCKPWGQSPTSTRRRGPMNSTAVRYADMRSGVAHTGRAPTRALRITMAGARYPIGRYHPAVRAPHPVAHSDRHPRRGNAPPRRRVLSSEPRRASRFPRSRQIRTKFTGMLSHSGGALPPLPEHLSGDATRRAEAELAIF